MSSRLLKLGDPHVMVRRAARVAAHGYICHTPRHAIQHQPQVLDEMECIATGDAALLESQQLWRWSWLLEQGIQ